MWFSVYALELYTACQIVQNYVNGVHMTFNSACLLMYQKRVMLSLRSASALQTYKSVGCCWTSAGIELVMNESRPKLAFYCWGHVVCTQVSISKAVHRLLHKLGRIMRPWYIEASSTRSYIVVAAGWFFCLDDFTTVIWRPSKCTLW